MNDIQDDLTNASALVYSLLVTAVGVRRQAEQCHSTPHFLITSGLGGGTGSGVGSQLLCDLRDQHPSRYIVTLSTVPSFADSPCQSLNSVLAGSALQVRQPPHVLLPNQCILHS